MPHPHNKELSRKELRSAIFGTLLGDSWLLPRGQFGCEQISLELIAFKRKILEELTGREITISERHRENVVIEGRKVNSKKSFTVRVNHPHYKKYYKVLYKEGKKKITASLLRRLSPLGIALWLMDDGYLDYKKSNNTRYLMICTERYSESEHRLIVKYFKETWDIDCFIKYHQRSKKSDKNPRIAFNGNNAQKLVSIIYKHILPCFYYKINLRYQRMDSINILPEYREAIKFISQNETASSLAEDIV